LKKRILKAQRVFMGYNFGTKIIHYWFVKNSQGFSLSFFFNFLFSFLCFDSLCENNFVCELSSFYFDDIFSFLNFFSFLFSFFLFGNLLLHLFFFYEFSSKKLLICKLELTFTW